jgi:hypothetical protein
LILCSDYALNIVEAGVVFSTYERPRQAALESIFNVHNNGSMDGLSVESVPRNRKCLFQSFRQSVEFVIIQNNAAGLGINKSLKLSLFLIN